MQGSAEKYTPQLQAITLAEAEAKRDQMLKALDSLQAKWDDTLNEIQEQCHEFMTNNETQEF